MVDYNEMQGAAQYLSNIEGIGKVMATSRQGDRGLPSAVELAAAPLNPLSLLANQVFNRTVEIPQLSKKIENEDPAQAALEGLELVKKLNTANPDYKATYDTTTRTVAFDVKNPSDINELATLGNLLKGSNDTQAGTKAKPDVNATAQDNVSLAKMDYERLVATYGEQINTSGQVPGDVKTRLLEAVQIMEGDIKSRLHGEELATAMAPIANAKDALSMATVVADVGLPSANFTPLSIMPKDAASAVPSSPTVDATLPPAALNPSVLIPAASNATASVVMYDGSAPKAEPVDSALRDDLVRKLEAYDVSAKALGGKGLTEDEKKSAITAIVAQGTESVNTEIAALDKLAKGAATVKDTKGETTELKKTTVDMVDAYADHLNNVGKVEHYDALRSKKVGVVDFAGKTNDLEEKVKKLLEGLKSVSGATDVRKGDPVVPNTSAKVVPSPKGIMT
jgi:hypothetical protein